MSKHEQNVSLLMEKIEDADAICVGAASGLSAAGGHTFYYQRDKLFVEIFGAYEKKYGYHNSFDGFYYRYQSAEERRGFLAQYLHFIFHEKPSSDSVYYNAYPGCPGNSGTLYRSRMK